MNAVAEELRLDGREVEAGGASVPTVGVPAELVEQPLPSGSPAVPEELSVLVRAREPRNACTLARSVLGSDPAARKRRALASVLSGAALMMVAAGLALLG